MKLPILAGTLRGTWWLPASGGKVLRIFGGTYEPEQTRLFGDQLRAGATFLDVGAHVGYYTLLAARLVGSGGRVCAFEPNPRNCAFLRRHVAVNGCDNVRVEEAAAADVNGVAGFDFGTGSGTGHLAAGGAVEVRTLRLDDFCHDHAIVPDAIKIDVEGAELDVLHGAEQAIVTHRPTIFLSTHGATIHARCLDWLRERGYALRPITGTGLDTATEVLCTQPGA
ncbi:hypothetical protein BH23GEM10_BH23GEM10_17630 [soil metagenome]